MIYITGDTHGDFDNEKINTRNFPQQKEMTKDDYIIICGDFGCVWCGDKIIPENYNVIDKSNAGKDAFLLTQYEKRNFTTLFVDGNHENHDLLKSYPTEIWNGGKVHKIRESIIHLMRGQVYTINGYKFFTMGGASSTDKEWRKPKLSWWENELPSDEEYREALSSLEKHNYTVDFVVTHCIGNNVMAQMGYIRKYDKLTAFFEELDTKLNYKTWFFGHYHLDKTYGKHELLFERVLKIVP